MKHRFFTIPKPTGPVNPAEVPIARAVLKSALIRYHGLENFNSIYADLHDQYDNLGEELWEEMAAEENERLSSNCKIIQLTA